MELGNKTGLIGIAIGIVIAVVGVAMPLGFDVEPIVWRTVFCVGVFVVTVLVAYLLIEHFAREHSNRAVRCRRAGWFWIGAVVIMALAVWAAATIPEPKNYGALILSKLNSKPGETGDLAPVSTVKPSPAPAPQPLFSDGGRIHIALDFPQPRPDGRYIVPVTLQNTGNDTIVYWRFAQCFVLVENAINVEEERREAENCAKKLPENNNFGMASAQILPGGTMHEMQTVMTADDMAKMSRGGWLYRFVKVEYVDRRYNQERFYYAAACGKYDPLYRTFMPCLHDNYDKREGPRIPSDKIIRDR